MNNACVHKLACSEACSQVFLEVSKVSQHYDFNQAKCLQNNFEDCHAIFYLTMKPDLARAFPESYFLQKQQSCLLRYSAFKIFTSQN
jgi:hypothetical protein